MRSAIVDRPIDVGALLAEASSFANGAAVVFVGTVRETNDGRAVSALDYKAYVPMAEKELDGILREASVRWPPAEMVCEHRIGSLALGDASVVIVAAHPHRAEAFDACRYVIEELKKRLPVWKRERYVDGEMEWVENRSVDAEVTG